MQRNLRPLITAALAAVAVHATAGTDRERAATETVRASAAHANAEHPAVTVARRAAAGAAIDVNTFVVGHPASPRWSSPAEPAMRVAQLVR